MSAPKTPRDAAAPGSPDGLPGDGTAAVPAVQHAPVPREPADREKRLDRDNRVDRLLRHLADLRLVRASGREAFAVIGTDGPRRVMLAESREFRDLVAHLAWRWEEGALTDNEIDRIASNLSAKARFDGEIAEVLHRAARLQDRIYVDLCDECRRAIEISPDGWRVVERPPVLFASDPAMRALPEPVRLRGTPRPLFDLLRIRKPSGH